MAKKFDLLESMGKHPGKWLLGAGALTAAKFAVGGYFIGKGMQAVKDKRAAKKKHKTTKLNLGGKYDYKITSYKKQPKKYMAG